MGARLSQSTASMSWGLVTQRPSWRLTPETGLGRLNRARLAAQYLPGRGGGERLGASTRGREASGACA
eukprot:12136731-Alexandrium_andersonii.AAC.1